jgi:hypothetical protein
LKTTVAMNRYIVRNLLTFPLIEMQFQDLFGKLCKRAFL